MINKNILLINYFRKKKKKKLQSFKTTFNLANVLDELGYAENSIHIFTIQKYIFFVMVISMCVFSQKLTSIFLYSCFICFPLNSVCSPSDVFRKNDIGRHPKQEYLKMDAKMCRKRQFFYKNKHGFFTENFHCDKQTHECFNSFMYNRYCIFFFI